MEYVAKDGTILTDEMFDKMAAQFEQEEMPGETVRVLVAPVGRPMISNEELAALGLKVPKSWKARIDEQAALQNLTRSQYLRKIVADAIF